MYRWSEFWNFKPLGQTLTLFLGRAFRGSLYNLVLLLLLRTTDIRKKFNERIVNMFRKKHLGQGVCLRWETRSLKRAHLASLSGSCSRFEMLSDINSCDALYTFIQVRWSILNKYIIVCLASNRFRCVIIEIILRKVLSYITLTYFPTIKVHLFAN